MLWPSESSEALEAAEPGYMQMSQPGSRSETHWTRAVSRGLIALESSRERLIASSFRFVLICMQ